MARPPKWTPEQRTEALRLYVAEGITAAVKATSIPGRTIQVWAKRAGVSAPKQVIEKAQELAVEVVTARGAETPSLAEVHDAVLTIDAKRKLSRAMMQEALIAKVGQMLARMDEPHLEFFATKDTVFERTYPRAPASAVRAYAQAFEILLRQYRIESGEDQQTTQVQARIVDMVDERDRPVVQQVLDMALQIRRARREDQSPDK